MQKRFTTIAMSLWLAATVAASHPLTQSAAPKANAASTAEIDRDVWSVLVTTVATDDIVGMGAVYFPDAVLVSPQSTAPIKSTLERWGRDMAAAKAKGSQATVEFRFSRRQDDATTAFEAGIFKYTVRDKSGAGTPKHYPFEMLLAKTNGKWLVLMERQFAEVTPAEWDKLPVWR